MSTPTVATRVRIRTRWAFSLDSIAGRSGCVAQNPCQKGDAVHRGHELCPAVVPGGCRVRGRGMSAGVVIIQIVGIVFPVVAVVAIF